MPDFDSAETANRTQVQHWLPHIDLLIYVVSPERYKDDNGWRLLLEHGHRHAWCFVINHWDRGNEEQREDFTRLLAEAGLGKPLLFCTDSSGAEQSSDERTGDELEALKTTVQSLADNNTIAQLEARGISIRAGEMKQEVVLAIEHMGSGENHQALEHFWNTHWQQATGSIKDSLQWKIQAIAVGYAQHEHGFVSSAIRAMRGNSTTDNETPSVSPELNPVDIIDDDMMARIKDEIGHLVHHAPTHEVPAGSVRNALKDRAAMAANSLNQMVQAQLQSSLDNPGSSAQRLLHKIMGILATVLPALAMTWAGYRIVAAFHEGGSTPAAYLSSNFAINAVLLVALSWALPYFLYRKTKPSREQAARKGLTEGVHKALSNYGEQVCEALRHLREERDRLEKAGLAIFNDYPSNSDSTSLDADQPLSRALLNEH